MRSWKYGSVNPEAGAIAKLLMHHGCKRDISEAEAFGYGGGIAFGYFVFEYKNQPPNLYIGTRSYWHDPGKFFSNAAEPCGGRVDQHTASTASAAQNKLMNAYESHGPLIVTIDSRVFEDPGFPLDGYGAEASAVLVDVESDTFTLDTGDSRPVKLDAEAFARGRSTMRRRKFEFFTVKVDSPPVERETAFRRALKQQLEAALHPGITAKGAQSSIGFAGLQKWLEALSARSGKQSWVTIGDTLENGIALMQQLHQWVAAAGTGGDGCRSLYGAFLNAHHDIIDSVEAIESCKRSARSWEHIAQTAGAFMAQFKDRDDVDRSDFEAVRANTLEQLAEATAILITAEKECFDFLAKEL